MSRLTGKLSIDAKITSIKDTLQRLNAGHSPDIYEEKSSSRRNLSYTNIALPASEYSPHKLIPHDRSFPEVAELIRNKDKFITELLNDIEESRSSHKCVLINRDLEIKELQSKITLNRSESAFKEEQVLELQKEKITLISQVNQLCRELESLEHSAKKYHGEISHVKDKLFEANNDKENLIREKSELKNHIEKLETASNKQESKIKRLKEIVSEQETQIKDLKAETAQLTSLKAKQQEEITTKNQHLEAFEQEKTRLEDKLKELKRLMKENSDKKYHLDDKEQMFKELEESWVQKVNKLTLKNKELKKLAKREKSVPKINVHKIKRAKSETKKKTKDPQVTTKLNLATASKIIREIMAELKISDHFSIVSSLKKLKDLSSYQDLATKLNNLISEHYPDTLPIRPSLNSIFNCVKKTFKDFFKLQKTTEVDQNALKKLKQSLNEEATERLPTALTILLTEHEHLGLLLNKVKSLLGLNKKISVKELEEEINNRL